MRDQAEDLRLKLLGKQGKLARSIAVVSGKGGVGKSNFTTNFAYSLVEKGQRVLIIDMDIGMGNIHILLGMSPKTHLKDYLSSTHSIDTVINHAPKGLDFISGGSGLDTVMEWSERMFDRLIAGFEELQKQYEVLIFDMGAGATQSVIDLLIAVDEIIVITTTEPTSITDAYSMMKFICLQDPQKPFYLVANRVQKGEDGQDTTKRLQFAMEKFLDKETKVLGYLPEDESVHKAVVAQQPYVHFLPKAQISKKMTQLADYFCQSEQEQVEEPTGFLTKLRAMFKKGRGKSE